MGLPSSAMQMYSLDICRCCKHGHGVWHAPIRERNSSLADAALILQVTTIS